MKELNSLQNTKSFAKEFLEKVIGDDKKRNVILLQGDLGTGKTTFSQFLLEEVGARGPFTSPTFVIMKKYEVRTPEVRGPASYLKNIYHLDCYRVDEESVLDLGWEEIMQDKSNLLLVEWPEKIKKIWPENYWLLKFQYGEDKNSRIVEIIKK